MFQMSLSVFSWCFWSICRHTVDKTEKGYTLDALRWFKSYFQDRTQTVQIGSSTSEPVTLKYGVPQGSVLGPILFTMYTTPLGNIIRNHNLDFHLYADDTQLYISCKPCDSISRQTAISQFEACISDIKTWMTNNLLKLNDDKTELIIVTTSETTSRQEDIVINIGDSPIAPSMEPPRNLGVLFDSTCCLNDHVNKICKNINYQLYSIRKIRKYLDKPTTEKMINSAVTSRLDYCNSLLYGINRYLVSQLQGCQNNAARIVSLRRKYDHITPVLKDLHWLPVEYRINYKILLLAYKAQHGMAPPYLSSLLSPYKPGRSLRSEGKHLLTTPRYNQFAKDKCSIPMDMTVVLGYHKFSLQATIDHHGPSIYSGHYTTSVNCCNRTFYCNDNKITEFDMINTKNSSTAYVVIYKLIT